MQGVIYKVTNKINGKVYIGQTINPKTRWRDHKRVALKYGCDTYFARSIRKYGEDSFVFEILEEFDSENIADVLNNMEIFYIDKYKSNYCKNGYNSTDGGGGMNGYKYTKDQKKACSERMKLICSSSYQKKIRSERMKGFKNIMYGVKLKGELNPMYGKSHSYETKNKISESLKGRCGHKHSEETKRYLSELNKGKKKSEETKQKLREYFTGRSNYKKRKDVWQFDMSGNYIKTWNGIAEAEKSLNTTHISCCCNLHRREAAGFQWRYAIDGEEPRILEYKPKPIQKKRKPSLYRKPIIQYSMSLEFIKEWNSLTEIENSLGFSRSNIRCSMKKENGFSHGYKWKYKQI